MGVITLMMSKGARGMAALHRQLLYIVGVVYFETVIPAWKPSYFGA